MSEKEQETKSEEAKETVEVLDRKTGKKVVLKHE
jgi:hypothetical protein